MITSQQEPGLHALAITEEGARHKTAEHRQPNQQIRLHVLLQLQEEATTLQPIQGLRLLRNHPMIGEPVLQPIQDLAGQPEQGAVLLHIANQALHQNTLDLAQAHEAARVIHGQAREAVQATHGQLHHREAAQVTRSQAHRLAAVRDIHSPAQVHAAAQVTHGQARVTQGQALVQAIQGQARLHGAVQAIQDQARVTPDPVPVHEAAQVIQVLLREAVRVHPPEGQAAVRADHQAEARGPAPGDKKQFTYYYFLKHLSNT